MNNEGKSKSIKSWTQQYLTQFFGNDDELEAAMDAASNNTLLSLE